MVTTSPRRDRHIEALRGLACVLLVAYHVIGNDPQHGMHIAGHNGWRLFTELFIHIRMPLFSFLSGYVFQAYVADRAALSVAFGKKLRRIGIPFVVVSTLFYFCFGLINHDFSQPIWQIYLLPYEHYWYLQATMLMMAALLTGNYIAGRHSRAFMTALFPVACAIFVAAPTFNPDLFAIGSAFYLLPYFLLGQLLRVWSLNARIGDVPARRRLVTALLGLAVAVLFLLNLGQYEGWNGLNFARQSTFGLLFGLAACLFLFFSRLTWQPLEFVGGYSYTIYLFHVFFTAALRKALGTLLPGLPNGVYFAAALVVGLGMPILLHRLLVRTRWTALLFLGITLRPVSGARADGADAKAEKAATT
ncbi:acyltransferase [Kaistia nematophila]|uniref:Acyltransferase n=1 Tax=Kaistia nematophila TaxID=2994654 RepID=A0A9X3ILT6_9HYPH|nr:acyltransferase [Kaistia nematophila]MCX5571024.1 acyltransferase [Kaistia nematophila]